MECSSCSLEVIFEGTVEDMAAAGGKSSHISDEIYNLNKNPCSYKCNDFKIL